MIVFYKVNESFFAHYHLAASKNCEYKNETFDFHFKKCSIRNHLHPVIKSKKHISDFFIRATSVVIATMKSKTFSHEIEAN